MFYICFIYVWCLMQECNVNKIPSLFSNHPVDCAIKSKHSSAKPLTGVSVYYRLSSQNFAEIIAS